LDKLDLKILSRLLDNCRESDRQIGSKIGISGTSVKSRIEKMLKNKTIENFALKIEPQILGYNVLYIVTTGQDLGEILKQVELIGEPFFVVPCVGGVTVCAIVVRENF
jgi:DNA-binding Lrp family transcriptional regulator